MTFDDFESRVDALLVAQVGRELAMRMLINATGGGVFNEHYDNETLRTEPEAQRLTAHIIRQTKRDNRFYDEALAQLLAGAKK